VEFKKNDILSGGGCNTPQILMLSGVVPRKRLKDTSNIRGITGKN
jgi:hypothetical protein